MAALFWFAIITCLFLCKNSVADCPFVRPQVCLPTKWIIANEGKDQQIFVLCVNSIKLLKYYKNKFICNAFLNVPVCNPVKPGGHYMYRQLTIHKFHVLPTQCICVFRVDLRIKSDSSSVSINGLLFEIESSFILCWLRTVLLRKYVLNLDSQIPTNRPSCLQTKGSDSVLTEVGSCVSGGSNQRQDALTANCRVTSVWDFS
jgi:hypothetical protein